MRAFKTFVGYVVFYTQPTKGSKSTTDCRQVNAEKPTKPAKNRQILKKAGKISLKSHEKTDNELYISGCTFSAAGGRRPGRSRDPTGTGRGPGGDWAGGRANIGRKAPGTEFGRKTGQKRRFFEQKMVLSGLLGACQESVT